MNLCNLSGLRDCIDQVKFLKNFKGKLTISSARCKQNTVELKNCSFSLKILRREQKYLRVIVILKFVKMIVL